MTIKLLTPWNGYAALTKLTLDAATETGLVNAKQATTDLTGGVDYVAPAPSLYPVGVTQDPNTRRVLGADGEVISPGAANNRFADVVVYGATPSGILAACAAASLGCKVLLISPNGRLGGMVTGGLARTDYRGFGPRVCMNVLTQEAWRRMAAEYGLSLGQFGFDNTSPYAVEPKVAMKVFKDMLAEYGVTFLKDYRVTSVNKQAGDIKFIDLAHRLMPGNFRRIFGRRWVEASYGTNFLIRAGVTYTFGREANSTYGEANNGVRTSAALTGSPSPYLISGNAGSGLLPYVDSTPLEAAGTADNRIQAWCHRLVMTNEPSNRLPIPDPANYNPLWYELLGRSMANAPTSLDSLNELFYRAAIPLRGTQKQDWNNQGAISLDFIGGNAGWVTTDYTVQDRILQNHNDYTLGLFKFLREDSRVPAALKTALADWGFCKDEFIGEEGPAGLSPEVYIREAARMVGDFVMTEAQFNTGAGRVAQDKAIAFCNYPMDSHPASKRVVGGVAHAEGGLSSNLVPTGYYGVEYRSMLPKASECGNLLVCCNGISASHTVFGSMRMEPYFMSFGEAAGIAAALSLQAKSRLHDLAGSDIQPYVRSYRVDPSRVLTLASPTANGTATWSNIAGWTTGQTFPPEFYGNSLWHDGNGNKGGRWVKFQPTFAAPGRYRILLNAPGSLGGVGGEVPSQLRCRVDVVHANGTDTFYIDARYGEWQFRELGVWYFDPTAVANGTQYIQVTNAGDPGVLGSDVGNLNIDGVAWHPVP